MRLHLDQADSDSHFRKGVTVHSHTKYPIRNNEWEFKSVKRCHSVELFLTSESAVTLFLMYESLSDFS